MNTVGIIAEYNPFHNGHKYQLEEIRRRTGADYILVAMSGNFVQRGEPAIIDKYVRTQMALLEGADLVLELPVVYATASAELFARGGVSLLAATGVVGQLCFGVESANLSNHSGELTSRTVNPRTQQDEAIINRKLLSLMKQIAGILDEEPEEYRILLRRKLTAGLPFPAARSKAILALLSARSAVPLEPEECTRIEGCLGLPNNILSLEYIRALSAFSDILPLPILRHGDSYHTDIPESDFASASAIRKLLHSCGAAQSYLPPRAYEQLCKYCSANPLLTADTLSPLLGYRLRSLLESSNTQHNSLPTVLESFSDCSPALARRIADKLPCYQSFPQFCDLLKTKELTHARIRRVLLHILLDIPKTKQPAILPCHIPYLRVLGFRSSAKPLLSEIKKRASAPLLTKMADASHILNANAMSMLRQDVFASDLYMQLVRSRTHSDSQNEFNRGIILV